MLFANGSYTIEAALVFPIVLYVVIFIIYASFYLHDRAVLREAVYETAIYGTTLDRTQVQSMQQKMQAKYQNAMDGRLVATNYPSAKIELKDGVVTVEASATMRTGTLGFVTGFNHSTLSAKKEVACIDPLGKIRIIKLIHDIQKSKKEIK